MALAFQAVKWCCDSGELMTTAKLDAGDAAGRCRLRVRAARWDDVRFFSRREARSRVRRERRDSKAHRIL